MKSDLNYSSSKILIAILFIKPYMEVYKVSGQWLLPRMKFTISWNQGQIIIFYYWFVRCTFTIFYLFTIFTWKLNNDNSLIEVYIWFPWVGMVQRFVHIVNKKEKLVVF